MVNDLYLNKEELNQIQKNIFKLNLIGSFGAILLGLGLYGIFGADGDAFHPLLNDSNFVYGILTVGVVIQIWEFSKLIPLLKRKHKLANEKNS